MDALDIHRLDELIYLFVIVLNAGLHSVSVLALSCVVILINVMAL